MTEPVAVQSPHGLLARNLLIVSHVVHYRHDGHFFAYGPYTREIAIWARLFPQIVIAAPCRRQRPPGDCLALPSENISLAPQPETGGTSCRAKLTQIALLPYSLWRLSAAMISADAIHVRCPGNLGLLGAMIAPLFSRRLIAKYAGQWSSYPGEAGTTRLQRAILRSRWWAAPVLAYGPEGSQPPHIIPFFASVLTTEQMDRASAAARARTFGRPPRLLYVGRLSAEKNVHILLTAVAGLLRAGVEVSCTIVGDGSQRRALEELVAALGIEHQVVFAGAVAFDRVLDYYERADILVLPSNTEGWPKTIAEGMAFGLVCVGSNRGVVPQMLADGRGFVVPPGDSTALTDTLRQLTTAP